MALTHNYGSAVQKAFPQPAVISATFFKCFSQYGEFMKALEHEGCKVRGQVSLHRVPDEWARLRAWGLNSRACYTWPGSLDARLRTVNEHSVLYLTVLSQLDNLHKDLERGMFFHKPPHMAAA
jgi:hypothetical protein